MREALSQDVASDHPPAGLGLEKGFTPKLPQRAQLQRSATLNVPIAYISSLDQ